MILCSVKSPQLFLLQPAFGSAPGGGLFGSTATTSSGGGLFGGSKPFGTTTSASTGFGFGNTSTGPSLFGNASKPVSFFFDQRACLLHAEPSCFGVFWYSCARDLDLAKCLFKWPCVFKLLNYTNYCAFTYSDYRYVGNICRWRLTMLINGKNTGTLFGVVSAIWFQVPANVNASNQAND